MVIIGIAAIIAVYRYVDERSGEEEGYELYARFDDVQGLIPKSRVVVAGISVGYIESIELDGNKAKVELMIEQDVPIHTDAVVSMRSASLLGEQLLVIDPGTFSEPLLEDGAEITVRPDASSTTELLRTANEIAQDVKQVDGAARRVHRDR